MNKTCLIILIPLVAISACRKSNLVSSYALSSWKVVEIYDKNNGGAITPPASSGKDVVISFLPGDKFEGHTLVNSFTDGIYTQTANKITFKYYSMTLNPEDQWGGSFLAVLSSCYLQSVTPCTPAEITIQGNQMKIVSITRYDLTLQRIN